MNTWDYIERVRASNGGCSDYRVAQILGISRQSMSNYKLGQRDGDEELAAKIAIELGLPAPRVIADLRLERAKAEGNTMMAEVWEQIRAAFAAPVVPLKPAAQLGGHGSVMSGAADAGMRKTRGRAMAGGKPAIGLGINWGEYAKVVAGDGIEPPTRGFSIPCSTD
jgi:transcriptional regulator with XRE-family HTH domain